MDLATFIAIFAVIATNLGTVIALYIQGDRKMELHREETNKIIQGIRDDMKQFQEEMKIIHGRMCTLEERYRKES